MKARVRRLALAATAIPLLLAGQAGFSGASAAGNDADLCKNGGWQTAGDFKNQGDCVSYIVTGAAAAEPPTLVTATSTNPSTSAVVKMSEPVLCSTVDGADFKVDWTISPTENFETSVSGCDGVSDDTFTVSFVQQPPCYCYAFQNSWGSFAISTQAANDVTDRTGIRQPAGDSVAVQVG